MEGAREHWRRSLRDPSEKLYLQREKAAFEDKHINLLKISLVGALSAHVCDMGNIVQCQEAWGGPFPNGSKVYEPDIGITIIQILTVTLILTSTP